MTHPYVTTARSKLGAPFRHRGRGPRFFDCVGLLVYCVLKNGGSVDDLRHYGREPHDGQLEAALRAHCGDPLPNAQMREGDFLLLREKGEPMHMAIVSKHPDPSVKWAMIHCDSRVGKVVEHSIAGKWPSRIVGVYRHGA